MRGWLGHLKEKGLIASYRITRRKLGLGPAALGEFHIMVETKDLAQLEAAFQLAARRTNPAESHHRKVYSMVENLAFGLWRDFPDVVRGKPPAP